MAECHLWTEGSRLNQQVTRNDFHLCRVAVSLVIYDVSLHLQSRKREPERVLISTVLSVCVLVAQLLKSV